MVGPLLTTKWHQDKPFNDYLSNDYPIGCVTVAIAQIINYNKFPNHYNWGNIPNDFATPDTRVLLMDVGNALEIKYSQGGSGATDGEAKTAFERFGYYTSLANHNYLNVKNEIMTNRRPVYMSGVDRIMFPHKAHAWVCDGSMASSSTTSYFVEFMYGGPGYYSFSDYGHYLNETTLSRLFFHMNWGWGGNSNGWYVFNSSKPTGVDSDYDRMRKDMIVIPR